MSKTCTVPATDLLAYMDESLEPMRHEWLRVHMAAGCNPCEEQITMVSRLMSIMKQDRTPEPPVWVTNRARRMFARHQTVEEKAPSMVRRIIGRLTMDSGLQPQYSGVRGGALTPFRQRVYETDRGTSIDLHQLGSDGGQSDVQGQLMVEGASIISGAGATITLWQLGERHATTQTDSIGEFQFVNVPSGQYDLTVLSGELDITIPGIDL